MQYIPQVKDICDFHAVQLINLDSSNMEPKHWKMMVHTIRENYEKIRWLRHRPWYGHNGIHCGGTFLYDTEFKKTDRDHRRTETDRP